MVKDHWFSQRGNPLQPHAPFLRQESTYRGLCYTSGGALAGTRKNLNGTTMKDQSDAPSHHKRTFCHGGLYSHTETDTYTNCRRDRYTTEARYTSRAMCCSGNQVKQIDRRESIVHHRLTQSLLRVSGAKLFFHCYIIGGGRCHQISQKRRQLIKDFPLEFSASLTLRKP